MFCAFVVLWELSLTPTETEPNRALAVDQTKRPTGFYKSSIYAFGLAPETSPGRRVNLRLRHRASDPPRPTCGLTPGAKTKT